MDSAPRDGTKIWVYSKNPFSSWDIVFWQEETWAQKAGYFFSICNEDHYYDSRMNDDHAVCWHELQTPDPPTEEVYRKCKNAKHSHPIDQ
jgi:hypothetical protein